MARRKTRKWNSSRVAPIQKTVIDCEQVCEECGECQDCNDCECLEAMCEPCEAQQVRLVDENCNPVTLEVPDVTVEVDLSDLLAAISTLNSTMTDIKNLICNEE